MMQPGSSYPDSTRASDADRADVCAILDNAYANGELDGDEHRQRCSSAMSAKTRGELLGMVSDLQARAPVFSQQPTIAVQANPIRKWIIGATVAGVIAAAAAVALIGLIAVRHHDQSPSPTTPADTHSSPAAGTFLPLADVVATVSGDFQDQIGHPPQSVNCPGDLDGHVGAFERCSITDNGKRYTADVTVTAVNGIRITTRDSIDEEVSAPPSRP